MNILVLADGYTQNKWRKRFGDDATLVVRRPNASVSEIKGLHAPDLCIAECQHSEISEPVHAWLQENQVIIIMGHYN